MSENEGGMTAEQVEAVLGLVRQVLSGLTPQQARELALADLLPEPPAPAMPERDATLRVVTKDGPIVGWWSSSEQVLLAFGGGELVAGRDFGSPEPLLTRAEWLESERVADDEATKVRDVLPRILADLRRTGFTLVRTERTEEGRG